jgi:tRNA (guanosine-2'-O-)-methyltransferase
MPLTTQELRFIEHLSQYISDHKKEVAEKVLNARTRHVTVVLENIYQAQNASATVRTCECMGIQDIHIIENTSKYEVNKYVLRGSYKWVNLIRYKVRKRNNTEVCFDGLRSSGYRIYATDPSAERSIDEIPLAGSKIALVFGNELKGLSDYALAHADERVKIPMYGFTESLNISASVAVCLATLIPRLRGGEIDFGLTGDEKDELRLAWYRRMVRGADIIEKQFSRTNP